MTLSAADLVAAQADGAVLTAAMGGAALSAAESAAAIKYNGEFEEARFLESITFGEMCSEGEGADAWARLAAALGSHVTKAGRHAANFMAMVRRIKVAIRSKEGVGAATEELDDESYAFGLVSFLKESAPRSPLRVFAGAPGGAAARSNLRAELRGGAARGPARCWRSKRGAYASASPWCCRSTAPSPRRRASTGQAAACQKA